jgi:uncharacterized protein YqhQ
VPDDDETTPHHDLQLGGMALRDGVMLQSPTYWSAAVRLPDGSIKVRSGTKTKLPGRDAVAGLPVARGLLRLVENLAVLVPVRRELGTPVLPQEDPRLLGATLASATGTMLLRRFGWRAPLTRELAIAAMSFAPVLLALRGSELARFHGAEHKSVAAFESGQDPHAADTVHDRCGSNLVGPIMLTNLAGGLALRSLRRERDPLSTLVMGMVTLGSAVEVFAWMARHRDHPLARLLRQPGVRMQQLFTTGEPDESQLDVAQAALQELLRLEGVESDAALQADPAPAL